ncbi:MAG: FAD-dependent oxidoreductase [Candidatus Abawacabacteria bacterium]|nr:FAD-dependent oxidoreductase [Candidatus Abawacabacteria bacterium]
MVRLVLVNPVELQFKAGQYLFIKASERVLRAYSIASSPAQKNEIEFCVKRVEGGVASNFLWNLQPNDEIDLTGTFGHFIYKSDVQIERIVMIGTGTGVAPLKSMIEFALTEGEKRPLHLFFGERMKEDFYYLDQFAAWATNYPNFTYTLCASREEAEGFFYGRVTQALEKVLPVEKATSFYLCGGQAMLTDVRDLLEKYSVETKNIYQEKFF